MKWSQMLKTGLAGLGGAVMIANSPAVADPAGSYLRKLYFTPLPAEACVEAAQRTGQTSRSGIAACAEALEDPEMGEDTRVATLTNRAILYRRVGETAKAVADCDMALASGIAGSGTVISCGGVYVDARQPEIALSVLSALEVPEPESEPYYYHNLALAHHDLGQYALAYEAMERALDAEPGFAPTVELKALYRVEAAN